MKTKNYEIQWAEGERVKRLSVPINVAFDVARAIGLKNGAVLHGNKALVSFFSDGSAEVYWYPISGPPVCIQANETVDV